ncbi:MAG: integrase family protein [Bacteroidia bacterium]|nr:integrase family protein [Bacteroidia bacterium]
MPGFGLRITPKGTKSFIYYYYNKEQGRYRTKTYGTYPAISLSHARKAYGIDKVHVEAGEDPASEMVQEKKKQRSSPTVNELIDRYEKHTISIGIVCAEDSANTIRRDFGRLKGHKKVTRLTKQDFIDINDEILGRGKRGACLESFRRVRRMMNVAVSWDIIDRNPMEGMELPVPIQSRDRVLSLKEIHNFWHGINQTKLNPVVKSALKMMLVTLQRGSEVRHAKWSGVLLDENFWEVPKELSKNNVYNRVALNHYSREIISDMLQYTSGCPYVFGVSPDQWKPEDKSRDDLIPMNRNRLSRPVRQFVKECGFNAFTPHDLRRTATTTLTGVGVPRFFVKKALNHADEDGATPIYDRYDYDYEKQKVAQVWEFVLDHILKAKTPEAVPSIAKLRSMVKEAEIIH